MLVPRKEIPTHDFERAIIANSTTLSVGDAIVPGTDVGTVIGAGGTTGVILGVVMGIYSGSQPGRLLEVNSWAAASNNETVAQVGVAYIPAWIDIEYLCDLDAPAGTTSGSNGYGYFNLSSANGVLHEASFVPYTTQEQFFSLGTDPLALPTQVVAKISKHV